MLIMRHELMRAESHIAVCCSYMSLCVYEGGGRTLKVMLVAAALFSVGCD